MDKDDHKCGLCAKCREKVVYERRGRDYVTLSYPSLHPHSCGKRKKAKRETDEGRDS